MLTRSVLSVFVTLCAFARASSLPDIPVVDTRDGGLPHDQAKRYNGGYGSGNSGGGGWWGYRPHHGHGDHNSNNGGYNGPTTRSRTLHVVNAQLAPDGFNRSTVVVDGMFPSPLIMANMGDKFDLKVSNELTDPTMRRATSVHWHGFFQNGTSEMDGPSFVNQCPIIPNRSFSYRFNTGTQSGTYWYHSHLASQYCDGLRGPLVVYDPNDPYRYLYDIDDESTVITLVDWYHDISPKLFPEFRDHITFNSTLINGKGRYKGGPLTDLAVVKVKKGLRYRLRVISLACDPTWSFAIDNHTMTVIEADGVLTKPVTVDSLSLSAGQRYSVVVEANQAVGNYWIRTNPVLGNQGFDGGINSAIFRYDGAPYQDPCTPLVNATTVLKETDLHTLVDPGAPGIPQPGAADVNLFFHIDHDPDTRLWRMNGKPFVPPAVPVLLQILSGKVRAQDVLAENNVISLPRNKVVELTFEGDFPHPMHLHGHNFDVIRSAGSSTYNFENPVRRDVVRMSPTAGENVTVRFRTDNPGPWFLHCHIEWHLDAGLALVFAEDAPDIAHHSPPSNEWQGLCPDYYKYNPDTHFPGGH